MRVLLTGGSGMLGRALRRLAARRSGIEIEAPDRRACDLMDRGAVAAMLVRTRCDVVVHAAARVGGIQANLRAPYGFLTDNLLMNAAVIDGSLKAGIKRLLFVGSSCMYPRDHRSPLIETDILAAPLEPTNEGYALSKIVGAKACKLASVEHGVAYRTVIPCNLYGADDTFDPVRSHLVSAAIAKTAAAVREGKDTIEIWGEGTARREFLLVDDLADFMLDLLLRLDEAPDVLNVGAIDDFSVNDYYALIADTLGFKGVFQHDLSKPVGMKRKLMDSSRAIKMGYRPKHTLAEGITMTARHYMESTS